MTLTLNLIFRRGRVTTILNFGLKIKGVPAHAKSSDPATSPPPKKKIESCTWLLNTYWTRPSPTSSLLHPDKVIYIGRSEAEPNVILYGRNQLDVG